jgi:hypothetical protein
MTYFTPRVRQKRDKWLGADKRVSLIHTVKISPSGASGTRRLKSTWKLGGHFWTSIKVRRISELTSWWGFSTQCCSCRVRSTGVGLGLPPDREDFVCLIEGLVGGIGCLGLVSNHGGRSRWVQCAVPWMLGVRGEIQSSLCTQRKS